MFFEQGLSGLNAAALSLHITGKNIANGSTTGYKTFSVDFTNVMANTLNTANSGVSLATGSGPVASNIIQSFTQGTISTTSNPLDVAINGKGFFQMQDPTTKQMVYTRDGQFQMTAQYNIVNSLGQQLTGFPAGTTSGAARPINLAAYQTTAGVKTTIVTAAINLAANSAVPSKPFDPTDSSTYAYSAPTQGYDATGNQYTLNLYFAKDSSSTSSAPVWNLYTSYASPATSTDFAKIGQLNFDSKGAISGLSILGASASGKTIQASTADYDAVTTAIGAVSSPTSSTVATAASNAIGLSTTLNASQIAAAQTAISAAANAPGATEATVTAAAKAIAKGYQYSNPNVSINENTFTGIPVDSATLSTTDSTAVAGAIAAAVTSATSAGTSTVTAAVNSAIQAISASTSLNSSQIAAAINRIIQAANQQGASVATVTAAALQTGNATGNVVTLDLSGMTQQGLTSTTTSVTNTGSTIGNLSSFVIGPDGAITGTYSNGLTANLGMIALANFASPTGLTAQGNNSWVPSATSGKPIVGAPGSGGLGALQASALENSNEDQTSDMVALLAAQRAYQANAQTIKAEDQMAQTLVNL
jgi:flagellar hook protein FlgE